MSIGTAGLKADWTDFIYRASRPSAIRALVIFKNAHCDTTQSPPTDFRFKFSEDNR